MILTLPWPPSILSPNARAHWTKVSKAKKSFRAAWAWTAKEQGAKRLTADALAVALEFFPPDRQHRDMDNMLASIKAGLDGLADVLGVDDSKWTLTITKSDTIGGFVRVTVESK